MKKNNWWVKVFDLFLAWKVFFYAIVLAAARFIPLSPLAQHVDPENIYKRGLSYWWWVWGNFDGNHYLSIADQGHHVFEYAFFPLFPLLIRLASVITTFPLLISGQVVSNMMFALSLLIIYKLLVIDKKDRLWGLFLAIVFLFPTAFFYTAVYNDSTFLCFATACLYFARKKSWVVASIFGALATLTRLNGLALFIFLLVEYWLTNQKHLTLKKIFKDKLYGALLIPLSFISYLFFIHVRYGSWQLVFSSMSVWNQQTLTFPLQVVWRYFKILTSLPIGQFNYWIAATELFFVSLYVFLLFYSFKKIRFSYWAFFLVSILIPSLTGTFQGMPRYALHLYPFFLSLTLFLHNRNRVVKTIYFILSIAGLIFLLSFFSRGYFVS